MASAFTLATETSRLTVPCWGGLAHEGHSLGAVPAVGGSHVAAATEVVHFRAAEEEAERFPGAAAPVSEPIHVAVAADEARSVDANRTAAGRSADAGYPVASSTGVTRSAED
jgi:hypothetical protein